MTLEVPREDSKKANIGALLAANSRKDSKDRAKEEISQPKQTQLEDRTEVHQKQPTKLKSEVKLPFEDISSKQPAKSNQSALTPSRRAQLEMLKDLATDGIITSSQNEIMEKLGYKSKKNVQKVLKYLVDCNALIVHKKFDGKHQAPNQYVISKEY